MSDVKAVGSQDYGGASAEQVLGAVLADVRYGLNAVGTLMDLSQGDDDPDESLRYWNAARDVLRSLEKHFNNEPEHTLDEPTRYALVDAGMLPANAELTRKVAP